MKHVLHVVGGVYSMGGISAFVETVAAVENPGLRQSVWVHPGYRSLTSGSIDFVRCGRAELRSCGLFRELIDTVPEALALARWLRANRGAIIHAHTRLGIFATSLVPRRLRSRSFHHFHALVGKTSLYRFLWNFSGSTPVFNSALTCRHLGFAPENSAIVHPPIQWPDLPSNTLPRTGVRFVASGRFVSSKNFPAVIRAFSQLGRTGAELHLYGGNPDPLAQRSGDEREVREWAKRVSGVCLHDYDPEWVRSLSPDDVFIHMGRPESFGMVILEAFARGCRLVVLDGTFLDFLPPPLSIQGIFRCQDPVETTIRHEMQSAVADEVSGNLRFTNRLVLKDSFSPRRIAEQLAALYAQGA